MIRLYQVRCMFCPNCGANIPGDFEQCPECGTEIYVAQGRGDDDHGRHHDPFIVAEDVCDVRTPFGQVIPVPGHEGEITRPSIIEAEEDLPEETGDIRMSAPVDGTDENIRPEETSPSAEYGVYQGRADEQQGAPGSEREMVDRGDEEGSSLPEPPHDTIPVLKPSSGAVRNGGISDDEKHVSPLEKSPSFISPPPPSRRRPLLTGMAVMILVVLGVALLVYGLPGQGSSDTGMVVFTPLPTAIPDTTPVPVTETVPPWTPSENLQLSVSAYGGGYKVEIDGGLKAKEVETIVLTVQDNGGNHTMEWVYPSRHETFYMARDAYGGTASATEYVTAVATYTDRKKEVVFSGDL